MGKIRARVRLLELRSLSAFRLNSNLSPKGQTSSNVKVLEIECFVSVSFFTELGELRGYDCSARIFLTFVHR